MKQFILQVKCWKIRIHYTWIQEESSGDKSFLTLSRMIPYIFSTYAISCSLNSKAGYLASTWRTMSIGPTERLAEEERKPWGKKLMIMWYFCTHVKIHTHKHAYYIYIYIIISVLGSFSQIMMSGWEASVLQFHCWLLNSVGARTTM